MKFVFALMILTLISAFHTVSALAQTSEWKTPSKINRDIKKAKKNGLVPTSIDCRHNPNSRRVLVKPQGKIVWSKPKGKTAWGFFLSPVAGMAFSRNFRAQGMRLVFKKRFRTGSKNTVWGCELWKR